MMPPEKMAEIGEAMASAAYSAIAATAASDALRWRNTRIETPPKDGNAVLAISDQGAAIVWYDPSMGATWVVMHLPLRGVTIAETLWEWHSWCPIGEWHRHINWLIHPEYYRK